MLRWLETQSSSSLSSSSSSVLPDSPASPSVVDPVNLLRRIRWSGLRLDYVQSMVSDNAIIRQSPTACHFIAKVERYLSLGVQFDGLLTHHRPSTKLERSALTLINAAQCATAVGVSTQYTGSVDSLGNQVCCRINLKSYRPSFRFDITILSETRHRFSVIR